MMNINMPVKLYAGSGSVKEHGTVFAGIGKKCLILTGKHSAKESGALNDVLSVLESIGTQYVIKDNISANPTVTSCREAGMAANEFGAEFIVGIGGGSVLDAAKAAAIFAARPDLDEAGFYAKEWPLNILPVILVGTTAGTGSEVTKVSVLTDSKLRKHSIHDDRMFARYAFGDPAYLESVESGTALFTASDVLMHAVESYFSKKADVYSRMCAVEAVRLVKEPLMLLTEGKKPEHEAVAYQYDASILAGIAINTTGTCFPHNVGYYLTENFGVSHGAACAIFLTEFIRHVTNENPRLLSEFVRLTGFGCDEMNCVADRVLKMHSINLTEKEIEEALPRWNDNSSVKNTIGTVTTDYIRSALMKFVKE